MREQRGWIAAGVLMVLGALVGAGAVWQHWRTCAGPQRAVDSGAYAGETDLGEACLQAMDDGFAFLYPDGKDPWRPEAAFGLAFALVLGLSWAAVVATTRRTRVTRWVAVLPLVLVVAVAGVNLLPRSDAADSAFFYVSTSLSLSVLLSLFVAMQGLDSGAAMLKVALALAAPAAIGLFASWADYALMVTVSDANWDTPPWTGTPTLVATALAGVALVVVALRDGRRARSSGSSA